MRIWRWILSYLGFRTHPTESEDIWEYARRKWGK